MICVEAALLTLVFTAAVESQIAHSAAAALVIAHVDESVASKEAALKSALFQMRDAIDRYYSANKRYPKTLKTLQAEGYLEKVPDDPFTDRNDSWRLIAARRTASNRRTPSGFYADWHCDRQEEQAASCAR